MSFRERPKESKLLFRELPYFVEHITQCHGRFNNLLAQQSGLSLPSKKYLDRLPSLHDIDLFSLNNSNPDTQNSENYLFNAIRCNYHLPNSFHKLTEKFNKKLPKEFSLIHNNLRSLKKYLENFQSHLLNELDYHFDVIGITGTRIRDANFIDFNPEIPGYNFECVPRPLSAGGVAMYIESNLKYTIIEKT